VGVITDIPSTAITAQISGLAFTKNFALLTSCRRVMITVSLHLRPIVNNRVFITVMQSESGIHVTGARCHECGMRRDVAWNGKGSARRVSSQDHGHRRHHRCAAHLSLRCIAGYVLDAGRHGTRRLDNTPGE